MKTCVMIVSSSILLRMWNF